MDKNPITKEQAIATAVDVGQKTYGHLASFEISVDEEPERWLVNFANLQALEDGEGQHFAVWVDKETGQAHLFKGR